ncbi:hypothetical protein [Peribacillus frigoritolerans]|uniref:hypothetical protein n=1 Tax=Peribacillus frigoritolerans TaxID=450367 RepID=UPI003819250E
MYINELFDIEKIIGNSPEDVLDAAIKSIFALGPIVLNNKEMNKLAYEMPIKVEFDVVSEHITYEEKDGVYEITVPSFDERELPEFQVQLFQKKVNDCFPERGFYITGSSKLIIEPLGLIKVEMSGLPIIRTGSDIRFPQTSNNIKGKGYQKYLYFYYDFADKEYHRVYSDKLEECKWKMEKNPGIVSDYHITVQEYIKREQLLDEVKKKIYKVTISYLQKLHAWYNSNYGDGGVTLGSVEKYLNEYKTFLEVSMDQNLKVKLIYANVTKREYQELMGKKEELIGHIERSLKAIGRIKEINKLTEENYKVHKFNATDSFSEEEIQLIKLINENVLMRELKSFKDVRPSKFPETINENNILKGYIGYDLKTNEVFPNIMQLQRRTSLTEEKEDFRSEYDYVSKVISELKKVQNQQG